MKKLMIAAAALASASAFAAIESDIVGYSQSTLNKGMTLVTPQFLAIGSVEGLDVQTLKPTGEDVDGDGAVNIQLLDAFGRTVDGSKCFWVDWSADDDIVGWTKDMSDLATDVVVAPGQALWMAAPDTTTSIQSAGKVGLADVVVSLRQGMTAVGNPFPVAIDLQDIIPTGDVDTEGGVNIQSLDAFGRTVAGSKYFWVDWSADDDIVGWTQDMSDLVDGVKVQPGQGLWVSSPNGSTSIRFPAPEL